MLSVFMHKWEKSYVSESKIFVLLFYSNGINYRNPPQSVAGLDGFTEPLLHEFIYRSLFN